MVESWRDREWTRIDRQKADRNRRWTAMTFEHSQAPAQVLRVATASGKAFQAMKFCAFEGERRKELVELDFSAYDRDLAIIEDVYRQRGLPLPMFLSHGPRHLALAGVELFGARKWHQDGLALAFARQLAQHLKSTGRNDRFLYKVADEPRDIQRWTDLARPFRKGGLRTMTCHGIYDNVHVAAGVMDPWCPNYQHNVFLPFFKQRQKLGEEFWWYCCGTPQTRITGKPIDNLPFYWLTAKWGFDGAMSYAALSCHESGIEGSGVPFRYDHGLSFRIACLPDGTLLDTTRRELESEGIQDCRLINYVKAKIARMRERDGQASAEALASRLGQILDSVVPYKYGYATRPEEWHAARDALYDLAQE